MVNILKYILYFFNSIQSLVTFILDGISVFLLHSAEKITKFNKYFQKLGKKDIHDIHPMTISTPLDEKTGTPWCTEIILQVDPNYSREFLFDSTKEILNQMVFTKMCIYINVEISINRIENETITRHRNIAPQTKLRKNDDLDIFFDSTLKNLTGALEYNLEDGDNETSITITIVIRNFI